jgi:hypothetical protein
MLGRPPTLQEGTTLGSFMSCGSAGVAWRVATTTALAQEQKGAETPQRVLRQAQKGTEAGSNRLAQRALRQAQKGTETGSKGY